MPRSNVGEPHTRVPSDAITQEKDEDTCRDNMLAVRIRVGVSCSYSVGDAYYLQRDKSNPKNSTIVAAGRSAANFYTEGYRQRPPISEGLRTSRRERILHCRALVSLPLHVATNSEDSKKSLSVEDGNRKRQAKHFGGYISVDGEEYNDQGVLDGDQDRSDSPEDYGMCSGGAGSYREDRHQCSDSGGCININKI